MVLRTLVVLPTLLLCLVESGSADRPGTRPLRVLFVGNSYTRFHNLPQVLSSMAGSAQPRVSLEAIQLAFDSYTLERHWEEGQALRMIRAGHWDLVVLQGHSLQPIRHPKQLHTLARKLDAEITQTGARTVFFMTWAHRDKPGMLTGVAQTYTSIAAELNATVAPVGLAWQRALQEHPTMALHTADNSHPAPHGTYLTACVLYASITGRNPLGLSTGGLTQVSPEDARFLQRIAWQTVTEYQNSRRLQISHDGL